MGLNNTTEKNKGSKKENSNSQIRYAVVGLGHIAQVAVLPAFAHCENATLTALVSGDSVKLRELTKKYKVKYCYGYDSYDECLASGLVDAVYIALPNVMHREYAERAAKHGVHVLVEKPMAVTPLECKSMIRAARENGIKLMVAYRLHFDKANLTAIKLINEGNIGEPRIFNSIFTMQVNDGDNIRLKESLGGGSLYDIGIYCINASRYLFQQEPGEVFAMTATEASDRRFSEVNEMTSAMLRFPRDCLASFTCSFGAHDSGYFEVIGTKGSLSLKSAYDYAQPQELILTVDNKTTKQKFGRHDQFAAEISYFSDCILKDQDPEPSGYEGLADVRIINALYKSASHKTSLLMDPLDVPNRPTPRQEISKPPVSRVQEIHARGPSD